MLEQISQEVDPWATRETHRVKSEVCSTWNLSRWDLPVKAIGFFTRGEYSLAIVIPPLKTIQVQLAKICSLWKIPFIDLDDIENPHNIGQKILDLNPKIIISSIEDIGNEVVQSELQTIDVRYIAMDECQVDRNLPCSVPLTTTNCKSQP